MKLNNYKITFQLIVLSIVLFACKTDNNLPDPLQAGWNNKAVCKLVEENENIRVLKCTFKPGVGHEKHFHKSHFGYALAGSKFRIKDSDGTREITATTGSSFYSKGTAWHEILNIGDSTAVYLIIEPK